MRSILYHVKGTSAAGRKGAEVADEFLDAELDSEAEAKAWLVEKIKAALEEAERAGYSKAMRKQF
jgi:hypothetical protein